MKNQSEADTQPIEHEPEPSFTIRDILMGVLFLATAVNGFLSIYALISVQHSYEKTDAYRQHSEMRGEWTQIATDIRNDLENLRQHSYARFHKHSKEIGILETKVADQGINNAR